MPLSQISLLFFFNDTATTEIYTLSLHDALPISAVLKPGTKLVREWHGRAHTVMVAEDGFEFDGKRYRSLTRSEEHTSELQSRSDLVCRLLLEKKKNKRESLVSQSEYT